jgi:hypothetical protein
MDMKRRLATALVAILLVVFSLGACNPSPGSSDGPAASGGVPGY